MKILHNQCLLWHWAMLECIQHSPLTPSGVTKYSTGLTYRCFSETRHSQCIRKVTNLHCFCRAQVRILYKWIFSAYLLCILRRHSIRHSCARSFRSKASYIRTLRWLASGCPGEGPSSTCSFRRSTILESGIQWLKDVVMGYRNHNWECW